MKFPKYISFFLLLLLVVNCSGLKSSWTNFRAHYNTYYNAEKSFNAGVRQVEEQPVEVNPEWPTLVHPVPPAVGSAEFDDVIEKGARILRKFPDSKWTDEALFLIGKSYYYKGNYFLAIEKFEELSELAENDDLRQQAALWKARSLLSSEQYGEGLTYVNGILDEGYLTASTRAELRVFLAEYQVRQENWEEAADHLSGAIADFEEGKLKGRVFFMYGQVLERLGRFGEAYFAYDNVASRYPEYDYIYWSRMKKAEVSRKEGNLKTALNIYVAMSRDDKNIDHLDRINYEIARTREMQGAFKQAEQEYNEILRSERTLVSPNVEAKTYFRLAKIYSEVYKDFGRAAAYFDSSASRVTNEEFLESSFNADQLASAYGSYRDLRSTISRLDSLLWLGSLSKTELDSVLTEIRRERKEALTEEASGREDPGGRLINVSGTDRPTATEAEVSYEYGFLNYKNARQRRASVERFQAVWGDRPLVDNWRRMEAVRRAGSADTAVASRDEEQAPAGLAVEEDQRQEMDIRAIPATEQQREEYRRQLAEAKYELGNLFFITLNMPDSAKSHFLDIVRNYPQSALVPQSMYSLYEINSEGENREQSDYWAKRILQQFPDSRYAGIVRARLNRESGGDIETDPSGSLMSRVQAIEQEDTLSAAKAEKLRRMAVANRTLGAAPHIHYRAIQTYVELAKVHTDPLLYQNFMKAREDGERSLAPDSAEWKSYPFYGSYWDSVRTVIDEHDSLFGTRSRGEKLEVLRKVLDTSKLPGDLPGDFLLTAGGTSTEELRECEAMEGVEIVGGMSNFMARMDWKTAYEEVGADLPETLTYELLISEAGRVRFYRRISSEPAGALEGILENGIEHLLLFDQPTVEGRPAQVRCKMTFPLERVKQAVPR